MYGIEGILNTDDNRRAFQDALYTSKQDVDRLIPSPDRKRAGAFLKYIKRPLF
jgi:hypothetical protein